MGLAAANPGRKNEGVSTYRLSEEPWQEGCLKKFKGQTMVC